MQRFCLGEFDYIDLHGLSQTGLQLHGRTLRVA
ncbi:MAG: hypothetical protein KER_01287 [Kerstersia gyiorum]